MQFQDVLNFKQDMVIEPMTSVPDDVNYQNDVNPDVITCDS